MIFWASIFILFIAAFLWALLSLSFELKKRKKEKPKSENHTSKTPHAKPKEVVLFEQVRLKKQLP